MEYTFLIEIMSRKKKILLILHLCLAFSYLFWLLIQPFVKEVFLVKSQKDLYEMIFQREALFSKLPQEDQLALIEGYKTINEKRAPSGHSFFVETPAFALAWLFFSLLICFLLLFHIEGAAFSTWLLPLIVLGYVYFLYDHPIPQKESLFPAEEYVLTSYVSASENNSMGVKERLLLGWHRYLVHEWAHEIPNEDPTLFHEQLDKALFAFNVARLKWILAGKGDEAAQAGFISPPSLLRLACYFMWNLFFAWTINRKEKPTSAEVPSAPTCSPSL